MRLGVDAPSQRTAGCPGADPAVAALTNFFVQQGELVAPNE
jgi:hypothetical protein